MFNNLNSDFKINGLKSDSQVKDKTQNHGMTWAGRDLEDHLSLTPLPWAASPPTRPAQP